MGGESLKGASPARRRRLGLYLPMYSSLPPPPPPPCWTALTPGSRRGRDSSGTPGSAPYLPLAFLSFPSLHAARVGGGGAGRVSHPPAESVWGGAD